MLSNTKRFVREYYLFVIAFIASIFGLIFQFSHHQTLLHWTLGLTSVVEVFPLIWGMWQDLRDGTYGIDILAATAIVTSVVMKQYWAAIIIVIMLTGGEALENYAENRAKTELNVLLNKAPKLAHKLRKDQEIDIPISQVNVGDKLIIRPGEVVPVDSEIIEGSANFDESSLTGENLPQSKSAGNQLLSGSVNIDGVITVKTIHAAADSQYEQIIKLVRSAANSQAPFVRLADRYSVPFSVLSFVIAGAAWIISGQSIRFLEVLVVATPCPLILAAPIAVISGMSRAAKQGIIIKNGGALERLAEAQTIAFDKTGTLTEGNLSVSEIKTFGNYTKKELISLAGAIEKNSNHVLSNAILVKAKELGAKIPKAKNVTEVPGEGLSAVVASKKVIIGRQQFLVKSGVEIPKTKDYKIDSIDKTTTFVSIDGKISGTISFKDTVRYESKRTIKSLYQLGIKNVLMITGDNKTIANAIAKQLGINKVVAEALPSDKLRAVEDIEDRPVAFVGDGVNDAPVLTASDIGIALGARGETAASESADMVIMLNDLSRVAKVFAIAKRTFSIAKQSILVGIMLSIVLMVIFSTGHFRPIYGAFIQEGVDVVVIFNALRAHTSGKESKLISRS